MRELSGDGELERKKKFRGRKKKEEEAGQRERIGNSLFNVRRERS